VGVEERAAREEAGLELGRDGLEVPAELEDVAVVARRGEAPEQQQREVARAERGVERRRLRVQREHGRAEPRRVPAREHRRGVERRPRAVAGRGDAEDPGLVAHSRERVEEAKVHVADDVLRAEAPVAAAPPLAALARVAEALAPDQHGDRALRRRRRQRRRVVDAAGRAPGVPRPRGVGGDEQQPWMWQPHP